MVFNRFFLTSNNNVRERPFWLYFCKSWQFHFKSCKILIYLFHLFLKSIHFCMFIIQNSWQIFSFSQNLKFFKISQWNSIFSCKFKLFPLFMNEEKWKKCWVVYVCYRIILERCAGNVRIKPHFNTQKIEGFASDTRPLDPPCPPSGFRRSWKVSILAPSPVYQMHYRLRVLLRSHFNSSIFQFH